MKTWLTGYKCNVDCGTEKIVEDLETVIASVFTDCKLAFNDGEKCFTMLFKGPSKSILSSLSSTGFLSLDIHQLADEHPIAEKLHTALDQQIKNLLWVTEAHNSAYKCLPPMLRDGKVKKYDVGQGGCLIEYDFNEVVFHQQSKYQDVRIMRSKQFGNCLYLDNDLNLAESDLSYTIAITGDNKEDFVGKDVLVLGGGDGGILNYLKDKGPKMITMIDIDGMVIEAAKIHLRGICGDSMDKMQGENYNIIVDDCVVWLDKYAEEGRKFDFIINDLTAIPVSTAPVGEIWDFLRLILSKSFDVLDENGKYFTQGNAALCEDALCMYEDQLVNTGHSVSFSKQPVCVPSYMEMWMFYTIWKNEKNGH